VRPSRILCALTALALAVNACAPMAVPAPPANVAVQVNPTALPEFPAEPTPVPASAEAPAPAAEPAPALPTAVPAAAEPTPAPQPPASAQVAPVAPAAPAAAPTQAPAPVFVDPNPCEPGSRQQAMPAPGSSGSTDFFRSFRAPLAPAPLYSPPGERTVGLQAGHWRNNEVPPELGRLQGGSAGGGKAEWEVNLDVARRTARMLEQSGVKVDVLPATVPPRYQAHAFISLHADGDVAGVARGFKIARPGFSSIPGVDDRLVENLYDAYGPASGLPRDDEHITLRMRYYYAFNSRRFCHAVAPGVPQAIVELGYMTSAADRRLLIGEPERLAIGLAEGIRAFLRTLP
jgi:N-acetylmuramoyl-L-alanine amidase